MKPFWTRSLAKLLVLVIAVALGLGLGSLLRAKAARLEISATSPDPDLRADESKMSDSRASTMSLAARLRADSSLPALLARELVVSSRVARWLHWLEAVEQATPADLPRLAELAKGDATATRLVASRWVQLDLQHMFDTLAADVQDRRSLPVDELAEVLLPELARRAPDAAIAALQGTNSFGTRESWRYIVAGYLIEKDPERGLRALAEWGVDNFAPRMTGVTRWAAADPRRASEAVLAHPAGYTSELAMKTIGKEWAKSDPAGGLEFASSKFAKSGDLATTLAHALLQAWAAQGLTPVADWLARSDGATRQRFSPAVVEVWARTDAQGALAWCETNLTGVDLARTVASIVESAAQKNVSAAGEFVLGMSPSPARARAAAAVAKHWFPGWRSGQPAPTAAIAWLAGLDSASAKRALEQIQWKWSNGDPKGMAEFVASVGSDKVPASADLSVARGLARQDPSGALAWASRLPDQRSFAAVREAFVEWHYAQPEAARKWLNALPPSDPRRNPFLQQH